MCGAAVVAPAARGGTGGVLGDGTDDAALRVSALATDLAAALALATVAAPWLSLGALAVVFFALDGA